MLGAERGVDECVRHLLASSGCGHLSEMARLANPSRQSRKGDESLRAPTGTGGGRSNTTPPVQVYSSKGAIFALFPVGAAHG